MIRTRAAGDSAVLLDLADPSDPGYRGRAESLPAAAAALAAAIRAAGMPGVRDVIPAACTVLVTVEPGSRDLDQFRDDLLAVQVPEHQAAATVPVCEIPVSYDGPDLAEVAALTGLAVSEVIERHQSAEYMVGWLGFSPGFGYLTGLDSVLAQVPRLDTPRLSVPAGSVAIAGGLAAVYPADSRGGWRLLGRTSARLWDPGRQPPAMLTPGMRVRFRAVADLPPAGEDSAQGQREQSAAEPRRLVEILQPGPLAILQDGGRPGFGHLGVPHSGAADTGSLRLANHLVGNGAGAACVEVTLGKLSVRFGFDTVAAAAGAPAPMRISAPDGTVQNPAPGSPFTVRSGSVLRMGSPPTGLRSYLAVAGGFTSAPVLGSRSTDILSGLGPAPLRSGDRLPVGPAGASAGNHAHCEPVQLPAGATAAPDVRLASVVPPLASDAELTAVVGPREDWFVESALETLASSSYTVTAASNRTGLRLSGPQLRRRVIAELPSEGIAGGSLQVSHDGQPILLLADHPTTGGYPVIAVLAAGDIDRAAQLRPGQRVRFRLTR